MSTTTGTTPSSAGEHADPTWDELATEAEELGYPLESCRKLLDLFCGSSIEDSEHSPHVAEAIIALIDKADRKRESLMERLDRLAKSEPDHGGPAVVAKTKP